MLIVSIPIADKSQMEVGYSTSGKGALEIQSNKWFRRHSKADFVFL